MSLPRAVKLVDLYRVAQGAQAHPDFRFDPATVLAWYRERPDLDLTSSLPLPRHLHTRLRVLAAMLLSADHGRAVVLTEAETLELRVASDLQTSAKPT
jgi:hypothetical protein